jgi:hypothetical protein
MGETPPKENTIKRRENEALACHCGQLGEQPTGGDIKAGIHSAET